MDGQSLHLSAAKLADKKSGSICTLCTSILFYTVAIIKLKYGIISVTCKASYYNFLFGKSEW